MKVNPQWFLITMLGLAVLIIEVGGMDRPLWVLFDLIIISFGSYRSFENGESSSKNNKVKKK